MFEVLRAPKLDQHGTKTGREEEEEQRRSEKRTERGTTCAPERLGSALGRHPSISRVPGGGLVEFATTRDLAELEFWMGWALKVSKSAVM